MFGRSRAARRRDTPPANAPALGTHTEVIVVANPDVPVLQRERALRMQIGRGLQGYSGIAVGYDQGDPAHSLMGLVRPESQQHLTAAQTRVAKPADQLRVPTAEYADVPASSGNDDPYMALAFNRIAR